MNGMEELMNGVRVLNTIPESKVFGIGLYFGIGVIAFFAVAFVTGLITMSDHGMGLILTVSVVFGCIAGMLFGGLLWYDDTRNALPGTYEVTISSGADAKEFCERFEIVEKNGEIYRIKERDE